MENNQNGLPWYACDGDSLDVVVSSRARLSRNLANFPFPARFRGDDEARVQTLIFDSFSQIQMKNEKFNKKCKVIVEILMKIRYHGKKHSFMEEV